ncbi:Hypothetical protein FKW44_014608, partial [Caligus rogercresseyi]
LSLFLRGTRELASTPGAPPSLPSGATRGRTASASGVEVEVFNTLRPLAGGPLASRRYGATWPSSAAPPPPGAPGLELSGPPGPDRLCPRSNMPHIQDKDFYSFWSPLPSEMQDIFRRGRGLPRRLCQVHQRLLRQVHAFQVVCLCGS